MTSRRLRQLVKLYGLLEHAGDLQARAAAVAAVEADGAVARHDRARRAADQQARLALMEGSRVELLAAAQVRRAEAAGRAWLVRRQAECLASHAVAAQQHQQSRTRLRQAERIDARGQDALRAEGERRSQAEADDRYASRLLWLRGQASARDRT